MNRRPRVYSYTRFSSLAQAGGDSVRRQTAAAQAWCNARGLQLVEDFADLGVSAFKGKNATDGALGVFMKLAEGGKIPRGSFLLVESLDRITRAEITTAVSLILRIIDAGVKVVTLADGAIYDGASVNAEPTKLIVSITILMRAHEESLIKSRRGLASWQARRSRAASSREPVTSQGPAWLKLVGGKWQLDAAKVETVRRIFAEAIAGKSLASIMRTLNDSGTPTFRNEGALWSAQTVCRVIESRAVLGEFQAYAGKRAARTPVGAPVTGYFPAIISPAVFAKAQLVRKSHFRQRGGGGDPMPNAFRGIAFTPEGEAFRAQRCKGRHGEVYDYLRASPRKALSTSKTTTASWRYEEFKALFILLFERAQEKRRERPGDPRGAERLKLEIEAVKTKEGNLARALAHGYLEAVEIELRRLGEERRALEERLLGAEAEHEVAGVELIPMGDDEALGESVRSLVRRIIIDAPARSFVVEALTGELFAYREDGGECVFTFPESVIVPFPVKRAG